MYGRIKWNTISKDAYCRALHCVRLQKVLVAVLRMATVAAVIVVMMVVVMMAVMM